MALKRKGFILACDMPRCNNFIDLETDDFEEAKDAARDAREDEGWTVMQTSGQYTDICPDH